MAKFMDLDDLLEKARLAREGDVQRTVPRDSGARPYPPVERLDPLEAIPIGSAEQDASDTALERVRILEGELITLKEALRVKGLTLDEKTGDVFKGGGGERDASFSQETYDSLSPDRQKAYEEQHTTKGEKTALTDEEDSIARYARELVTEYNRWNSVLGDTGKYPTDKQISIDFPPEVEQWRSLVKKYFPPELVDKALWTIQYEGNPQNDPNNNGDGGVARGLFQIQDKRNFADRPDAAWLDVAENNIKYAAQQLGAAGGDWSAWGEGSEKYDHPYDPATGTGVFGALGNHPFGKDSTSRSSSGPTGSAGSSGGAYGRVVKTGIEVEEAKQKNAKALWQDFVDNQEAYYTAMEKEQDLGINEARYAEIAGGFNADQSKAVRDGDLSPFHSMWMSPTMPERFRVPDDYRRLSPEYRARLDEIDPEGVPDFYDIPDSTYEGGRAYEYVLPGLRSGAGPLPRRAMGTFGEMKRFATGTPTPEQLKNLNASELITYNSTGRLPQYWADQWGFNNPPPLTENVDLPGVLTAEDIIWINGEPFIEVPKGTPGSFPEQAVLSEEQWGLTREAALEGLVLEFARRVVSGDGAGYPPSWDKSKFGSYDAYVGSGIAPPAALLGMIRNFMENGGLNDPGMIEAGYVLPANLQDARYLAFAPPTPKAPAATTTGSTTRAGGVSNPFAGFDGSSSSSAAQGDPDLEKKLALEYARLKLDEELRRRALTIDEENAVIDRAYKQALMGQITSQTDLALQRFAWEKILADRDESFRDKQLKLAADEFIQRQKEFAESHGLDREQFLELVRSNASRENIDIRALEESIRRNRVEEGLATAAHQLDVDRFVQSQKEFAERMGLDRASFDEQVRQNGIANGFTERELNEAIRRNAVEEANEAKRLALDEEIRRGGLALDRERFEAEKAQIEKAEQRENLKEINRLNADPGDAVQRELTLRGGMAAEPVGQAVNIFSGAQTGPKTLSQVIRENSKLSQVGGLGNPSLIPPSTPRNANGTTSLRDLIKGWTDERMYMVADTVAGKAAGTEEMVVTTGPSAVVSNKDLVAAGIVPPPDPKVKQALAKAPKRYAKGTKMTFGEVLKMRKAS